MDVLISLLPSVLRYIETFQQNNAGRLPTVEEMKAELLNNIDKYISEGEEWLRAHPQVP